MMKKYFMTDTDEEVQFGDVIETKVVKDFGDGRKIARRIQFNLSEGTLPYAIQMRIIEEKEVEEDDDLLEFEDDELDETIEELLTTQEDHDKRIEMLEEQVKVLKTLIDDFYKEKKTASPKKK